MSLARTEPLTDADLRRLAEENDCVVYTETEDAAGAQPVPRRKITTHQVMRTLGAIRDEYTKLRCTTEDDDQCRKQLKFNNRHFREFAIEMPRVFMKLTDKTTTAEEIRVLHAMLAVQDQVDAGIVTREQANRGVQHEMLKRYIKKE